MPFDLTLAGVCVLAQARHNFNSLDFCTGIANDMIIWDEDIDGSYNDNHLTTFLQVTKPHNLELGSDKMQLK